MDNKWMTKTDYYWNTLNESNYSYIFSIETSRAFPNSYSSTEDFVSTIQVSA